MSRFRFDSWFARTSRWPRKTAWRPRAIWAIAAVLASFNLGARSVLADAPPNIVLIYADDLGYGDLGCHGAKGYSTPNFDRLAAEGIRFADFYVAQAVCSASRAALLTGCYPNRLGIAGALGPKSLVGIHDEEVTIAERTRELGYDTAIFGKWHLGHHPRFLPTRHGFGEYFGLPYSNDMWRRHPESGAAFPALPLIDGERVIELDPDQSTLTTRYTEHAVEFIERKRLSPFFLYLAHAMPHVPLHVARERQGKSVAGLFGDTIEELDWSLGQILAAIERSGLDERTLVVFSSDNGPWLSYGDHAGSTGGLREGKMTTFEGGIRVPCLARWPGKIPPGRVSRVPCMTIDWFPTFARLAETGAKQSQGAREKQGHTVDGVDLWPILASESDAPLPREALYFYWNDELQAVRHDRWKLHFPHSYRAIETRGEGGKPGRYMDKAIELSLFDLLDDPQESKNVADRNPDVVARLVALAESAREDLGDSLTKRTGSGVRPSGRQPEAPQ